VPTRKAPPTIDDPDRGDAAAPSVSLQLERGQRMRLSDQLYGQIFDRIASGQLNVGDKLPSENEICRQFGVSRPVVREALLRLRADGLVTALTLLDPRTLIIGGGLAEAGETLFAPLREAVRRRITFQKPPSIVPAALGDTAGCLGAGLLARDLLTASAASTASTMSTTSPASTTSRR